MSGIVTLFYWKIALVDGKMHDLSMAYFHLEWAAHFSEIIHLTNDGKSDRNLSKS